MTDMTRSRYREERTLVRGLHRLPNEDRAEFKAKVLRLRRHFEQFNRDASELCQWLMAIRPDGKRQLAGTRPLWDFILGLGEFEESPDEERRDRARLFAVEMATKLDDGSNSDGMLLPDGVRESARLVSELPLSQSGQRFIGRFTQLSSPHRMILVKSAAEWVFARYARGLENQQRQFELWQEEKAKWEEQHPELTPEIRESFNRVFAEIGIRIRSPRVCPWERLRHDKKDCEYAGERLTIGKSGNRKAHSPMCVAFKRFLNEQGIGRKKRDHFVENALDYLKMRRERADLSRNRCQELLFNRVPQASSWFPGAWEAYLAKLSIKEETLLTEYAGELPHCTKFDEKSDCSCNPHTDECVRYREMVRGFPSSHLTLEMTYREWRSEGFSRAPRKPSFKYPSARALPMPKIFGHGFHELSLRDSVVRLRLDDMPKGRFLDFGFKPWPKDYDVQPENAEISSVHVTFSGTRARIGFRFRVQHRASRFDITQDEIDALRTALPRASQDNEFLERARQSVVDGFQGDARRDMRILSVDLGTSEAAVGVLKGTSFIEARKLEIVKLGKLSDSWPEKTPKAEAERRKGLSVNHVNLHLENRAKSAAKIAEARKQTGDPNLRDHDLRRFTSHIAWMIRDWVRLNARQIIAVAEKHQTDLIIFESLRGFAPPAYASLDTDKKRRLAFFAYGRIRRKVAEKAVERGMLVLTVPYKNSSRVCSKCGHMQENIGLWTKNKGKDRKFTCEKKDCNFSAGSDENAARVLPRVFWGEISLPDVKQPKDT